MKNFLAAALLLSLVQPAMAQRKYLKEQSDEKIHIETVMVQGGSFDMGSNDEAADRKPAHTVTLKDFKMGRYEVTEAQWNAVMGNNPSSYEYCSDCPVVNVSWNEIQEFIQKLNAMTGKVFRLPTEAEWEYAARGGQATRGKKLSGKARPQTIAWYEANSKNHIHKIGRKQPNELDLYDMSGNAEEWCADWYGKDYYTKHDTNNPTGPDGGNSRVVRGGSWESTLSELTVTRRAAYLPDTKSGSLGFRLVEVK